MKTILVAIFITLFTCGAVSAQEAGSADLFVQITATPAAVRANAMSLLDIDAGNAGNDSIVRNSAKLLVTVGVNCEIIGIAAGTDPRWTVFAPGSTTGFGNTFQLRNTGGTFPAFDAPKVFLTLRAFGNEDSVVRNIQANISFLPGSFPIPPFGVRQNSDQGNIGSNDNGTTSLLVANVLPIKLNDVGVTSSECASTIRWSTSLEEATTVFGLEYSADGRNFVNVATIEGKKKETGSTYEYTYNQGNGRGFYRLRIVGKDGSISYSKVVNTLVNCNAKKIFIYPNPVKNQEIMNVNIVGFDGKVKGELFAADTKLILTRQLINGLNTVAIGNLPQGNYTFKVTDENGESKNYKIVVVK